MKRLILIVGVVGLVAGSACEELDHLAAVRQAVEGARVMEKRVDRVEPLVADLVAADWETRGAVKLPDKEKGKVMIGEIYAASRMLTVDGLKLEIGKSVATFGLVFTAATLHDLVRIDRSGLANLWHSGLPTVPLHELEARIAQSKSECRPVLAKIRGLRQQVEYELAKVWASIGVVKETTGRMFPSPGMAGEESQGWFINTLRECVALRLGQAAIQDKVWKRIRELNRPIGRVVAWLKTDLALLEQSWLGDVELRASKLAKDEKNYIEKLNFLATL